jgi:hypothetical protein
MNPNLAAQGATGRALVAPPTSVMDERYPAWKKSQDDAENLMNATEMIGAAIPLAGPAVKGAAALSRYAGPELARGLENYMVKSGGILPMDTWHGSPHRFPPTAKNPLGEFDASKIGTGEGAQAYGHGLYLAEDPSVGAAYRRQLSGTVQRPDVEYKGKDYLSGHISGIEGQAVSTIADALAKDIPIADAIKQARGIAKARFARDVKQVRSAGMGVDEFLQSPEEYKALLKQIKATDPSSLKRIGDPRDPGNLYKVDLPDEQIAKMLDWDKPLSQQSWYRPVADVVKEYKGAGKDVDAYAKLISKANARGGEVTGGQLYEGMLSQFGGSQAKVSEFMREAGIPGIRYLDQGSRSGGAGTSNFVVFDPAHMNIIGRE